MSSKKSILKALFWGVIIIYLIILPLLMFRVPSCFGDLPLFFQRRFIFFSCLITVPVLLVLSCFKKYRKKSLKILLLILLLLFYLAFISAVIPYSPC